MNERASRFDVLREAGDLSLEMDQEDQCEQAQEEVQSTPKAHTRGKRPLIKTNEKYLANSGSREDKNVHEVCSKGVTSMRHKRVTGFRNRAAAKNEHTLVRGSKDNTRITRTNHYP